MKVLVRDLLRQLHCRLTYLPSTAPSGADLIHDLQVVVNRDSPLCFDVGANQGQTIQLFQKIFKSPRIHSFEPSTEIFQKLRSRPHGDQVFLHNMALGREDTTLEFTNYEDPFLSSFLSLDTHEENRFRNVAVKSKETVPVYTVDSFIKQNGIEKIDLLKIDTQGFDLQVLQGAVGSLQQGLIRTVFVELNFIKLYEQQSDVQEIIDFLQANGIYLVDFYEKVRQNNRLAWCTAVFAQT